MGLVQTFELGRVMANGRLRESEAQHQVSDKRLERGVHGALTLFLGGKVFYLSWGSFTWTGALLTKYLVSGVSLLHC